MFPIEKYKFYTDNKTYVIAESTYAGIPIQAKAKCSPEDTFDLDFGKKLAAARCNLKICKKRYKVANEKVKKEQYFYEISYNQILKDIKWRTTAFRDKQIAEEELLKLNSKS